MVYEALDWKQWRIEDEERESIKRACLEEQTVSETDEIFFLEDVGDEVCKHSLEEFIDHTGM